MSLKNFFLTPVLSLLLSIVLGGCGFIIQYLGDTLPPTEHVDVYYDAKEVKKEYRIMGRMTNDQNGNYSAKMLKREMLKKARAVGADAIIFSDLSTENAYQQGSRLVIKAELIKYL